jgi:hypothetical protein
MFLMFGYGLKNAWKNRVLALWGLVGGVLRLGSLPVDGRCCLNAWGKPLCVCEPGAQSSKSNCEGRRC